jgi:hypothetical protein
VISEWFAANWFIIILSLVITVGVMYHLAKRADRTMLAAMRKDGLTEQGIIDIVGIKGYQKMKSA